MTRFLPSLPYLRAYASYSVDRTDLQRSDGGEWMVVAGVELAGDALGKARCFVDHYRQLVAAREDPELYGAQAKRYFL